MGRLVEGDRLYGQHFMREVYLRARPDSSARVTVPVLWDCERETIVSNEFADILRMFDSAFDALTDTGVCFSPQDLRDDIDAVNERVYDNVNNGVYRCGFATSQQAYECAFDDLFATLDALDEQLSASRFLVGGVLTEADWRLFTTLLRFDAVYFGHFKCNQRRIEDYPALSGYLRDLYQYPAVAQTVDFAHIQQHYYYSHDMINPTRSVPKSPILDLGAAHDRQQLGALEVRRRS